MSTIKSLKKDELLLVAEELGLDIPQNPKIIVLKNLIESSEIFETDKEFLQSVIDGVLAEKAAKIEQEKFKLESERAAKIEQGKFKLESEKTKIEFEKIKLEQLKKELELTNAKFKNLNVKGLIPENINLADDSFYVPGPIDCLLGAEIFYELLRSGQIRSENSNLIFQNTVFGFVASGSNSFADTEARVHCGLIKGDLNQTLKMFWELENVEVEKPKNEEAIFCEDHFQKTHSRDEEGRYVVKMTLKNEPNCLGESRDIALKRLNALCTRLIRDPQYLKLYRDFIHEYDQLGHMKEVVAEHDNSEVAYYMPHHGVLRPEKSTTKLRVVFNATNPTSNGLSLNSIQYNGGLVQNDLFTIMIEFREHPCAFTANVKMMYRMILIHESQQPLLRILWKESPEDPRDEEKNFPLAAPVLRENFYMDDVLCGAASLMEAKALKNQLSGILKKGGMELHKWGSSHPELASNILGDYEFENPIETKTLECPEITRGLFYFQNCSGVKRLLYQEMCPFDNS
ncbi:uncharacterized protein TNCV_1245721 [Trichonephila clavipes]|uniref:Peptidase aspartic putative domain-containing protein n=1 Tax=Trichonephila clavipes TaxID=2585209 RepID=A0A8X6V0X9_TRICX|nr:uncharacterized protein TNCV_1245721 [Trichonephila clavipes]